MQAFIVTGVNETQRLNSLLRVHFGSSILEDYTSKEGVKKVSENAYSTLSSAMKGINKYPAKDACKEETHDSLYEFITNLKNDPLPIQYSKAAQENFDARHDAWCVSRMTAFNKHLQPSDEDPKFTFTYGRAQMWINLTLWYLTLLGHPTAVANHRYFHVPVNYTDAVHPFDALGVTRPLGGVRWSQLDRHQYWDYQQQLRAAGINLLDF